MVLDGFLMAASLLATAWSCILLVRLSRPAGPVDALLLAFLYFTASIVTTCNVLSGLGALARPRGGRADRPPSFPRPRRPPPRPPRAVPVSSPRLARRGPVAHGLSRAA